METLGINVMLSQFPHLGVSLKSGFIHLLPKCIYNDVKMDTI